MATGEDEARLGSLRISRFSKNLIDMIRLDFLSVGDTFSLGRRLCDRFREELQVPKEWFTHRRSKQS
jgi:hypothetical protein